MANAYDQKILGEEQKLAFARKLRESAMQQDDQGRMVSGWYQRPDIGNALVKAMQGYAGMKGEESAQAKIEGLQGQKQQAIADAVRGYTQAQTGYNKPEFAPSEQSIAQQAMPAPSDAQMMGQMQGQQVQSQQPSQMINAPQQTGSQFVPPSRQGENAALMNMAQIDPQQAQLAMLLRQQGMSEDEKAAAREEQRRQFEVNKDFQNRSLNQSMQIAQGGWDNAARVAATNQKTDASGNPIPKLTEGQAKATTYGSQMQGASNQLDKIEAGGFDPLSKTSQAQVGMAGGMTNMFAPAKAQQYKQAQEQWAESFLRAKTGAAATSDEVALNRKTFFPQLGDSAEVVAQKRAARAQAENDVLNMAGAGRDMATKRVPLNQGGASGSWGASQQGGAIDFGSLK